MPARPSRSTYRKKSSRKTNKRKNKHASKIFVFVLLSLLAIGFLGGFFILNSLNKRLVGAESATTLDNDYFTFVFAVVDGFKTSSPKITKLTFSIFDTAGSRIDTYTLPTDYTITLQDKFGDMPVSKMFALGLLNNPDSTDDGINFVNDVLFRHFALPIDRFVYVDEDDAYEWQHFLAEGGFVGAYLNLLSNTGRNDVFTNLSTEDIYNMSNFIKGLPSDRKVATDITNALPQVLDENIREMTISSRFAKEAKSIAVLNATDRSGIASFGARVVGNLGGRVVSVDNSENRFDETFMIADDPDDYSVRYLARIFGITKIVNKSSAQQYITDSEMYRADILLILAK